jgi:choline dehydrogenase
MKPHVLQIHNLKLRASAWGAVVVTSILAAVVAPACGPTAQESAATHGQLGYEYIVVGSGAGGGPLAARLARAGKRVLLIEAGADVGGLPKYQVPAMHALATEDPDFAWWYFVQHHRDVGLDKQDSKWTKDGILYPRGSALGGSTAVNAMVTVLPSPSDWNRLADLVQTPSFRANAMDKYYAKVREWLSVELPDPRLALGDGKVANFLTAAALTYGAGSTSLESAKSSEWSAGAGSSLAALLQGDLNENLRAGESTGLYRLPLATKNGQRNGPREFILRTVQEGYPLTVMTGTFVTRVLWANDFKTARGVEVVHAKSVYQANLKQEAAPTEREELLASSEVVLSAGAFNTPQLLQLSGIGPAEVLKPLQIPQVVDLPGVGQNLQDRYEASVVSQFETPLDVVAPCKLTSAPADDPCYASWQTGQGVYRTPGFFASLLTRSSEQTAVADLQIFAVPSDARGYYPGYSRDSAAAKHSFTWLLLKAHTKNRDGSVQLSGASPFLRPKIAFNSYDEAQPLTDPDLLAMVQGVQFVRKIQTQMRTISPTAAPREVWPGPNRQTDAEVAEWIRRESWGHHACCTAKMGTATDPQAVVDAKFRVRGTAHLRVVDASVFPEIPGTFIALPIYMIAEKAAATLLGTDSEAN